ncbi:MAG: hypothetical protein PVI90_09380 [Desulfobacteraceae bacterium]|jgi:hypothetical protein
MIIKRFRRTKLKLISLIIFLLGASFFFLDNKQAVNSKYNKTNNSDVSDKKKDISSKESSSHPKKSFQSDTTISNKKLNEDEAFTLNFTENNPSSPPTDPVEFEKWTMDYLRKKFGDSIQSKSRQADLLGLRDYMMKRYPEDWQSMLYNIVNGAFPENADAVFETFAQFDTYNQWFEDNASNLVSLDYEMIKERLNQKQYEIFGDTAAEIWSPESKTKLIKDVLSILNHAENTPLEDQLYVFKNAVEDAYHLDNEHAGSSDADQLLSELNKNKIYNMTSAFISLDSVQSDLSTMHPDERAESLYQIRSQMGFDDAALEAMAQQDRENDQKWQNGAEYMTAREELTKEYSGDELEIRLEDLREKYFDDEAQTIAAEENADFFRYKRKRIYGRN